MSNKRAELKRQVKTKEKLDKTYSVKAELLDKIREEGYENGLEDGGQKSSHFTVCAAFGGLDGPLLAG